MPDTQVCPIPLPIVLATARLSLRPFQAADIPAFAAYRSDPEVARYQSWEAPYTLAQAEQFVTEMSAMQSIPLDTWYQLAIERRGHSPIIGDCAFRILPDDGQQAEIGFSLARAYQGQGYASEAVRGLLDYLFGDLRLHRVRAICDAENEASSRLLERIGLRREAHYVENIWFKGRWGSEYAYAVLAGEWPVGRNNG
ncbi:MAG: GNAT family N-acetyltransferase [Ardenticatenaceae bacterium]|nr:GNAT family N-acetyltransferase [Ardenticatenaceae bacterium]MCB8986548.1 GNAT family N-acetyltransferase [Ardenticatenaceae bacterium]